MFPRAVGVELDATEMLVAIEILDHVVQVPLRVATFFVGQDGVDVFDAPAPAAFLELSEDELLDGRRLP